MSNKTYIKVCGNTKEENSRAVMATKPDLMGFIFHKESPRYASLFDLRHFIYDVPEHTRKVGVFVNEPIQNLKKLVVLLDLHLAQLHGGEDVEYCKALKQKSDFGIIKVFQVDEGFDFNSTKEFEDVVHFFLFDTKSAHLGGSGKKFNWEKLKEYTGELSFFLAGGIGPEDVDTVMNIGHEKLIGVDLNSGFEVEPGIKNTETLQQFITEIRK